MRTTHISLLQPRQDTSLLVDGQLRILYDHSPRGEVLFPDFFILERGSQVYLVTIANYFVRSVSLRHLANRSSQVKRPIAFM